MVGGGLPLLDDKVWTFFGEFKAIFKDHETCKISNGSNDDEMIHNTHGNFSNAHEIVDKVQLTRRI